MSKTCKDFGEVLVALGQGKTVVDIHARRVNIFDEWFQAYCEDHDDWIVLEREDVHFEYPAPIYEEPKTVEISMWLNVYPDGVQTTHTYRYDAEVNAKRDRIACIHIKRTVTEGEGIG